MNKKINFMVIEHKDKSMSVIPKDSILYITEWFGEDETDVANTMICCRVTLKTGEMVVGKYNREFFSPDVLFSD